ncbi:MAG: hypothetical protein BGO98_00950 [Myxococcales bacterium 68-20]|nr:DUF2271 domain-containing protein [Myxococcales bacterium]OJY17498.1 MAG: hypothetical protein BGO98_00950 [Myxococcales bacterium 68-20]
MVRSRAALQGGKVGLHVIGLLGAAALGMACDPTRTDASYWDRRPGLASEGEKNADAGEGRGTGAGGEKSGTDTAGDGGAVPSGACARVEVTTISYRGEYAPENVGAIWIATASGAFVRTLDVWGNKRLEHAVAWQASSNGNDVDAITGATRRSAGAHIVAWDCRDARGAAVAPGSYVVHLEFTEENSSTESPPGPHRLLPFELAASVSAASVPDDATSRGFRIVPLP